MPDSPLPGVDWGKCIEQKNGRGKNMHYYNHRYSFERNGGLGGSDVLLKGPNEALNLRDMFFFGFTV